MIMMFDRNASFGKLAIKNVTSRVVNTRLNDQMCVYFTCHILSYCKYESQSIQQVFYEVLIENNFLVYLSSCLYEFYDVICHKDSNPHVFAGDIPIYSNEILKHQLQQPFLVWVFTT